MADEEDSIVLADEPMAEILALRFGVLAKMRHRDLESDLIALLCAMDTLQHRLAREPAHITGFPMPNPN